jgi:hypothetical protein
LLEFLTEVGQTVTGRGIALGCKAIKRIDSKFVEDTGMSSEQIAKQLLVHAQPINTKEYTEYYSHNWSIIKHSREVVEYWVSEYDKYISKRA